MMPSEAVVGHIALYLPPGVPPHERPAWRRALGAVQFADLTPRGLPPRAILVVRRLADPQPGGLWSDAPWRAGDRWGAHARAALESCWRGAARPANGLVPADAQAVWFADQSEWLACLSEDLLWGRAGQRWWWRHWLRAAPQPIGLGRLWRDEVRWLPAALALLAERPGNVAVAVAASMTPTEIAAVRQSLVAAHDLPPELAETPLVLARVGQLVPGGLSMLPVARPAAELLSLALALHHAPAALRRLVPQLASPGPPLPDAPSAPPYQMADEALLQASQPPRSLPPSSEATSPPTPAAPTPAVQSTYHEDSVALVERPPPGIQAVQDDIALVGAAPRITLGAAANAAPGPAHPLPGEPAPEPLLEVEEQRAALREELAAGVTTGLGGVWYLVNLLRFLDLLEPPDFEGEPPGPWALLDGFARALLGDAPSDPLWGALEELAGHELPDPRVADWAVGRLALIHNWLAERRIDLDTLPALLAQPARLYLTRTHVDIVFRLDQIDLPVRLAGLDQDPGWVPVLGRVIAFHFDDL